LLINCHITNPLQFIPSAQIRIIHTTGAVHALTVNISNITLFVLSLLLAVTNDSVMNAQTVIYQIFHFHTSFSYYARNGMVCRQNTCKLLSCSLLSVPVKQQNIKVCAQEQGCNNTSQCYNSDNVSQQTRIRDVINYTFIRWSKLQMW
jgi:hypothetical protein